MDGHLGPPPCVFSETASNHGFRSKKETGKSPRLFKMAASAAFAPQRSALPHCAS